MHTTITGPERSPSPHHADVAADVRRLCDTLRNVWGGSEQRREWALGDMIDWLENGGDASLPTASRVAALAFFRRLQSVRAHLLAEVAA